MTIWILAVVLLAALAGVGYRQGAVRVAFSLLGLLLGASLALPLARVVKPLFPPVGVKDPVLISFLAPLGVLVIVLAAFKAAGLFVHRKVDVYHRYHAGDLQLWPWERLNSRLGLCLGLANAAVYLVLISLVIYVMSYWTTQIATGEGDPRLVRILNKAGRDLETTGLIKAVRAIDPLPRAYYDAGDIVGLIYQNPLLHSRLTRYPAFLGLAERPEFKNMANDKEYQEMLQRRAPIREAINHPKTKAILGQPQLLQEIWGLVRDDLKDLRAFLETGRSPKYANEPILGRWAFDLNGALALVKKTRPTITASEMQRLRKTLAASFTNAAFIATPDKQAILRGVVRIPAGANPQQPPAEPQTVRGQWRSMDGKYHLTIAWREKSEEMEAVVEEDKMTVTGEGAGWFFVRED